MRQFLIKLRKSSLRYIIVPQDFLRYQIMIFGVSKIYNYLVSDKLICAHRPNN